MSNLFISLFALLAILQVLDVVSTAKGLKNPELAEANPVVSFFIKKLGIVGGLVAIKLLIAGVVTWALKTFPFGSTSDLVVLIGVNLLYIYIVVNNFKIARS